MLFILKTLVAWRKVIIASGLVAAVIMAGVSLLLPKWYQASTSIFPPEPQGGVSAYASLMQNLQLPMLGPAALGVRPGTIYIDILRSRTVGEQLVNEFDLQRVYEKTLISEAVWELHKHTTFTLLENGLLVVEFEDRDPERAAKIADRYFELLDDFNRQLNVTQASKTREFIAGQIDLHNEELREAEEDLKSFQQAHQALELSHQVKTAIEVVSELTAEAVALEVELDVLGQYAAKNSEEYIRKKRRYDGLLEQLNKFKVSSERSEDDVIRSFFPSLDDVPQVALELARFMRRVKVEEKIYELLIQEYEKARIEEARDTPTVQILDMAKVPELRSRPKRKLLVLIGGVLGIGWSSLIAVFMGMWRRNAEQKEQLRELLAPIASDLRRLRRRK